MDKLTKCTAVILSGGSGSRMNSSVPKQYMPLLGKPLIWYALNAVQNSSVIDDCILVTADADIDNVRANIVEKYRFSKVKSIVPGGSERCFSVANALKAADNEGYIFIHDGARPFLTEKILKDTYEAAVKYRACVAAVPVKDTIKTADGEGFVAATPDRNTLWSIQTPQTFEAALIKDAYLNLTEEKYKELLDAGNAVTDDAGVVELFTDVKVKLVMGSYENIKVTTPGDITLAECILANYRL
jgi:2-C-methyl-D-erythritol 4-phosphate cytidylyltransferase